MEERQELDNSARQMDYNVTGRMEGWQELSNYNVGAILGAFLLGFVIQFTFREEAIITNHL